MFQVDIEWNPLQSRLKEIILNKDRFEETRQLLLTMHSLVHSHKVYQGQKPTFMDEIWEDLNDKAFRTMPTEKDDTIAWNIWHITRIEDLTSNYLIAERDQVLDESWMKRLNTKICDTGNVMSDPEILDFSAKMNMEALYEYRNEVGKRTREIIESLKTEETRRRVAKAGLDKIEAAGGATQHPDSLWLLDFWGRKNIAGIFQMPITRHQIVHLNDCRRLKKICSRIKL